MHLTLLRWAVAACLVSGASAQLPDMVEGWPYLTRIGPWSFWATPRLSMQASSECGALFFNTATRQIQKFDMDASFCPGWPVIEDSVTFHFTPIVVDIDHDSHQELVTIGTIRPWTGRRYLYIVDNDGSFTPGFPLGYYRPTPSSLKVADLDGDGEYEILLYSIHEGLMHCIDRFANAKPGWPVHLPDDMAGHGAAIGDLDLDGRNEYVVFGWKNIYAFEYDGSMHEGFPIPIFDTTYYYGYWGWGPVLADVDQDGFLEILTSGGRPNDDWTYSGFVAIYEHDGRMKQGWPMMFPHHLVMQTPIAADINGDNTLEIGFSISTLQGTFFVDPAGNNLPGWPAEVKWSQSDLIVIDIDGDNDREIFADYNILYPDSMGPDSTWHYGYSYIYGYDHLGQQLPGYPLVVNGWTFRRPPTFGYDSAAGRLYMAIYSENIVPWDGIDTGYVELYLFPDSTGPPDQWPMLSHDNLMTRNYNFVDNVTAIQEGREIIPKTYILKQNYPNPFNSSTVIEFALPDKQHVSLSVYDILGRRVGELVDGELEAGSHRVIWQAEGVSSGVYFYLLTTEKTTITRKMTLLR